MLELLRKIHRIEYLLYRHLLYFLLYCFVFSFIAKFMAAAERSYLQIRPTTCKVLISINRLLSINRLVSFELIYFDKQNGKPWVKLII